VSSEEQESFWRVKRGFCDGDDPSISMYCTLWLLHGKTVLIHEGVYNSWLIDSSDLFKHMIDSGADGGNSSMRVPAIAQENGQEWINTGVRIS
jgi:hypothetical protein